MVVFCDSQIPVLPDLLRQKAEVIVYSGRNLKRNDLISSNCEALFTRSTTKVNKELLEGTRVRFVGSATSGIDHVDLDYLEAKGIYFTDAKGCNANSVAEYVIFSILHWHLTYGIEIQGLTIGIIGYGNIGRLVAKYSNLLGLKILINDPPLKEMIEEGKAENFPDYCEYCELSEVISNVKILTNHVPLTFTGKYPTHYLVNNQNLHLLSENALFIHTSRGGVVDEKELLKQKEKKKLALVIDVWENEPRINTNLIEHCLIATPHIAGYSYEGKLRGTKKMIEEFSKFFGINFDTSLLDNELKQYKPIDLQNIKSHAEVYNKINQSRQLLEDFEKFKKILHFKNPEEQSQYFDYLRKNYPIRREVL